MLFGFKRRFAPFVEDGTKRHTIRAQRAIEPRVGMIVDAYVDPRQKTMRLLGRFPIVRVERIRMRRGRHGDHLLIEIDAHRLSDDEAEAFLFRDGFREAGRSSMSQAAEFWRDRLKDGPWDGTVVHWDYVQNPPGKRKVKR